MREPKRGFTLVELLVVISIIALLLSILMPSLQKVRVQAQSVICMTNLRALGQVAATYMANGSKDRLPPCIRNQQTGDSSIRTWDDYLLGWGSTVVTGTKGEGFKAKSFYCPSDKSKPVLYQMTGDPKRHTVRSYTMNDRLFNGANVLGYVPLSMIPKPAATIYLFEFHTGYVVHEMPMSVMWAPPPPLPSYGFTRGRELNWYHLGSANNLYFDLHVAQMKMADLAKDCQYASAAEYVKRGGGVGYSWCWKKRTNPATGKWFAGYEAP